MRPSISSPHDARSKLADQRRGRMAELAAACLLVCKGYRIRARRHRTPYGEIDIIATRWRRIAFVEVKYRPSRARAEAALTPRQGARIAQAADYWLARRPRFAGHVVGLDAVLVLPRRLPVHLPNALDEA